MNTPPPLSRLLIVASRREKKRSEARRNSLRNYFRNFLSQVKNEVTRGQKRSNFQNRDIPTKPRHNLRNYDSYEKTEERFSIPLEILYRQYVIRFDLRTQIFAPEVIEIKKAQY